MARAQRGAIEVKFALDGATPAFLREDMTLSVEVQTAQLDAALVLPQSALRVASDSKATSPDTADVLVVQDGRAQVRTVRLGLRTLGAVAVQEGLADGDTVLRDGSAVAPGQRVRPQVVRWLPAGASSAEHAEDAGAALTGAMGR